MNFKDIISQLNVIKQCRKYNLLLWQCPSFLTIMMGAVTLVVMAGTYLIANYYVEEPEMAALTVIIATIIVFIIGYFIVNSFNYMAEASRMKSEFVGIASHQLRTPLSALKWALSLLIADDNLSDQTRQEYLGIIKKSNERMIKLVNDLLDVTRIEQGRLDVKPEKFSLLDLVKSAVEEMEPVAQSRNISLKLEGSENLPDVWADPSRIQLVFQNLLDNSIKYTDAEGLIKIQLKLKGNQLKCEVIDNGVGIPNNQKEEVFQKFFRSGNVKKNQVDGTGLGLFIAKAIIDISKGAIGFDSQEGEWSNFWFTLPIIKS